MASALSVGDYLQRGLRTLAQRYECVRAIRGAGLFIGVEIAADHGSRDPGSAMSLALVNRLRQRHVLISACGREGDVLKIRPPLPFSTSDADEFLSRLEASLAEI